MNSAKRPWLISPSARRSAASHLKAFGLEGVSSDTNKQTLLIEDESSNQIVSIVTAANNPGVTLATWTDMSTVTNGSTAAGEYFTFSPTKTSAGLAMSGLAFLFDYTMTT